IIWSVVAFQLWALNTRNPSGWNNDDMRGAQWSLEHGKASVEPVVNVDLETRKRDADAAVDWQAHVMDEEPQPASVGRRYRMRLACGRGSGQAQGCRKNCKFRHAGPDLKFCSSAD